MSKAVLALVDDLFFSTKIISTARLCGVPIRLVTTGEELVQKARSEAVQLIIVDLNGRKTRPVQTLKELRASSDLDEIPVLAYVSHVQTELQEEARNAGARWILPRSVFSARLAEILKDSEP